MASYMKYIRCHKMKFTMIITFINYKIWKAEQQNSWKAKKLKSWNNCL